MKKASSAENVKKATHFISVLQRKYVDMTKIEEEFALRMAYLLSDIKPLLKVLLEGEGEKAPIKQYEGSFLRKNF